MSKKKNLNRPATLPTTHKPGTPFHDYFEYLDLNNFSDISEALNALIKDLKSDYFLQWEAVISEENDFPLTKKQKSALENLISFDTEWEEEGILYINEIPRPSELWYEIARKIASHLVEEKAFDTTEGGNEAIFEGWPELLEVLKTHATYLSLPENIESVYDIFPPKVFHQLNLQLCLDTLSGLGQDDELTLEDEEQQIRIEWLINALKEHTDMVSYFKLTLETLLSKVKMPTKDEKIFIDTMVKTLNLPSEKAFLLDYLLLMKEKK